MKKSKKAEEGMPWYLIAAILALVTIVIGFVIISKSRGGSLSVLFGLKDLL